MFIHNNGFKYLILAFEVIVDAAQCQVGMLRDLPHGCGMVTMLHKQLNSSIFNLVTSALAFGMCFFGHRGSKNMNERSFLFYSKSVGFVKIQKLSEQKCNFFVYPQCVNTHPTHKVKSTPCSPLLNKQFEKTLNIM